MATGEPLRSWLGSCLVQLITHYKGLSYRMLECNWENMMIHKKLRIHLETNGSVGSDSPWKIYSQNKAVVKSRESLRIPKSEDMKGGFKIIKVLTSNHSFLLQAVCSKLLIQIANPPERKHSRSLVSILNSHHANVPAMKLQSSWQQQLHEYTCVCAWQSSSGKSLCIFSLILQDMQRWLNHMTNNNLMGWKFSN